MAISLPFTPFRAHGDHEARSRGTVRGHRAGVVSSATMSLRDCCHQLPRSRSRTCPCQQEVLVKEAQGTPSTLWHGNENLSPWLSHLPMARGPMFLLCFAPTHVSREDFSASLPCVGFHLSDGKVGLLCTHGWV